MPIVIGSGSGGGTTGPEGPAGPSAYTVAVANGFAGTEAEWLDSLVGPAGSAGVPGSDGAPGSPGGPGEMGPAGPAGPAPFTVVGDYDNAVTYTAGQAVTYNGELWLMTTFIGAAGYVPTTGANWLKLASKGATGASGAAGSTGATGSTGPKGDPGDSAYLVAVANGFSGSESAWLASLVGATGAAGAAGATGATGAAGATGPAGPQGERGFTGFTGATGLTGSTGPKGDKGDPGDSAYAVAVANGYSGTQSAWLASLVGATGAAGAAGAAGTTGATGPAGAAGAAGPGVAAGGTAGQVLQKASGTDYDTVWATIAAGTATKTTLTVYSDTYYLMRGMAVQVTGSNGTYPTVTRAANNGWYEAHWTVGLVPDDIYVNTSGSIVTYGLVENLNTSGLTEGGAVYLATGGYLTSTKPTAPAHAVQIGWCVKSSSVVGSIFVDFRPSTDLADAHDVNVSSLSDGQVLTWNSSNGRWQNATPATPSSNLDALTDVTLTSPTNGQLLTYDTATSQWKNVTPATPVTNLDGLSDVTLATPADGQALVYDAATSQWKNTNLSTASFTTVTLVTVASSRTLALTDAGKTLQCTSASAMTLTVPLNSAVAFPIGTRIDVIQTGAGQVTFAPTSGAVINPSGSLKIAAQYGAASLIKTATDTWILMGLISA